MSGEIDLAMLLSKCDHNYMGNECRIKFSTIITH